MEEIISRLSEIHSISCGTNIFITNDWKRKIYYEISGEDNHLINMRVLLPYNARPKISDEIVSTDSQFINGFKVVQTANGEFAYMRESDGVLLPYRYDIATRFNQYGLAMVAKDGHTTWINDDFQYLSPKGEMKAEDTKYAFRCFEGFGEVHDFSTGNYPLSRVIDRRDRHGISYYLTPEGKIKKFYQFNGSFDYSHQFTSAWDSDFKDKDYIIGEAGILFAKGYYCPLKYVLALCEQNGTVSSIYENAEKCFKEEKGYEKVLKSDNL